MKALIIGSLNIDHVYQVEAFVTSGETISALDYSIYPGGKGLNQAIALSNAGLEAHFVGCIGKADQDYFHKLLAGYQIDPHHIRAIENAVSGHAVIQRNPSGQNCIIVFKGANFEFTEDQIDSAFQQVPDAEVVVLQNEINKIDYIIRGANARGIPVILNPSPLTDELTELDYNQVTYLVLNENELEALVRTHPRLAGSCRGKMLDDFGNLEVFHHAFPQCKIVLTLGSRGSLLMDGDLVLAQDAFPTEVIDTTAAGDTFLGYFTAALVQGENLQTALQRGSQASAIAISRPGAAPSIPFRSELDAPAS